MIFFDFFVGQKNSPTKLSKLLYCKIFEDLFFDSRLRALKTGQT